MVSIDEEWEAYKLAHNKKYDAVEDQERKKLYLYSKQKVEEHNERFEKGEVSYSIGINQFSDQRPEELKHLCGGRGPRSSENEK